MQKETETPFQQNVGNVERRQKKEQSLYISAREIF